VKKASVFAWRSVNVVMKHIHATSLNLPGDIPNGTYWAIVCHCWGGRCNIKTMDGIEHEISDRWDLIIAHPPCTYISNAGVRFLYPNGKGILNEERLRKGIEATHFFLHFLYADCDRIAVENPIPSTVYCLPKYSQIIQPYMFGHPLQKKTCLWLKNLPKLQPTNLIPKEECQSTKIAGNWFNHGGKDRQGNRAKTFWGIARAMAEQWG